MTKEEMVKIAFKYGEEAYPISTSCRTKNVTEDHQKIAAAGYMTGFIAGNTYAEQEAIAFAEWVENYAYRIEKYYWRLKRDESKKLTNSELYAEYKSRT